MPFGDNGLHQMSLFEWYLTNHVVKNRRHNNMCFDELNLCAQNMDTTAVNTVEHKNLTPEANYHLYSEPKT